MCLRRTSIEYEPWPYRATAARMRPALLRGTPPPLSLHCARRRALRALRDAEAEAMSHGALSGSILPAQFAASAAIDRAVVLQVLEVWA